MIKAFKYFSNYFDAHPEIEAVVLASENSEHRRQVRLCAERRINVLSMKIPSFDMKEYAEMEKLVKESGKTVAVKLLPGIPRPGVWAMGYPLDGGKNIDALYEGISFEVKGDGSDEWGCITIGESRAMQSHVYFPLKSKEWKKLSRI